jgi:hypothetical protein
MCVIVKHRKMRRPRPPRGCRAIGGGGEGGWCRSTLTNSMKQSPWEANSSSASKEIPRVLWNTKVHYRIHNSPPPVPILNHINSVHAPLHPTSWISILILSSHLRLGLPIGLLPSGLPTKNPVYRSKCWENYIVTSREQIVGQNHNMKMSNELFQNVAKFTYLITIRTY